MAQAQAQDASPVEEPLVPTAPLRTLLFGFVYLVIFIAALVAIRRWIFPNSGGYTLASGLFVLLILGFLSQTAFSELIGQFLVPIK
jgi:hypothetical protein